MAFIAGDLESLPISIPVATVTESRLDQTSETYFAGGQEQRVDYAGDGANRARFDIRGVKVNPAGATALLALWDSNRKKIPFKFTWRETLYYVRFEGIPSVNWTPPEVGEVSFSLIQFPSSEIVE